MLASSARAKPRAAPGSRPCCAHEVVGVRAQHFVVRFELARFVTAGAAVRRPDSCRRRNRRARASEIRRNRTTDKGLLAISGPSGSDDFEPLRLELRAARRDHARVRREQVAIHQVMIGERNPGVGERRPDRGRAPRRARRRGHRRVRSRHAIPDCNANKRARAAGGKVVASHSRRAYSTSCAARAAKCASSTSRTPGMSLGMSARRCDMARPISSTSSATSASRVRK